MATVLVVDDSATNRVVMARILKEAGHHVLEAVNGAEAVGLARLRRPDVIVTDVLMPKVDGYELDRELRSAVETAAIPIVFHTTAYSSGELRSMVQESPRVRILPKSADPDRILEVVASLVGNAPVVASMHGPTGADHLALLNEKLLRTVRELEAAGRERQQLLAHVIRAQEDERAAIAGDIHDDSVQAMTAVGMRLALLARDVEDPDLLERHRKLQETVRLAIDRLRRLLFQLHPPALDRDGLAAAIEDYLQHMADTMSFRHAIVDDFASEPPNELRLVLYRVVQEALLNVAKHADARTVRIELTTDSDGFAVEVRDDGRGFAVHEQVARPGHLGLSSMRQRTEVAGGRCEVDSAPGRGTTVRIWLPAPSEEPS